MAINITNELTIQLKNYIKELGFIDTGNLLNKVKVINEGQKFYVSAPHYIKYLDDGNFLINFFNKPIVLKLIESYVVDTVNDDIQKSFDSGEL